MKLKEIQEIIKDFEESSLRVLELEYKDVKIKLSKNENEVIETIKETKNEEVNTNIENIEPTVNLPEESIKSPLVGIFYAASSPEEEPYVKVGDTVKKGDTVCIIEAMKIMNEITATHDGVIEKIHVSNGEAVGYDDILFTVKKNGA